MDFPAIGKVLADLGGWAAFLTVVTLIGVGGYRRWWVWGWVYDRADSRAAAAQQTAERNAESLESMSRSFEVMGRSYDRLERDYDRLSSGRVNRDSTG